MNARLYDPALMQFLSPDPLVQHGSAYAYCSNNPLKYTDPTGMYENVRKHRKGGEEGGPVWVGMNRGMDTGNSNYGNWVSDYIKSISGDFGNYAFQEYSDSKKERDRAEVMKADFNLFLKEVADYMAAGFEINIAVRPEGIYGISIRDGNFFCSMAGVSMALVEGGGFSSSSVSAAGVLLQIGDNVSTLYNHDTYRQTNGKIAPIRKPNGQLRTSQQAQRAIRGSRLLKLGSFASNGFMAYNGVSSYSGNRLTLRNGSDMVIGTLGTIGAGILLFSNPVGWVATGCIIVGAGSAIYGTATTGYDIYDEITGD